MSNDIAAPSPEVLDTLLQLEDSPASSKATKYNDFLSKIISTSSPEQLGPNLVAYAQSILGDSIGIVAARPIFANFVTQFDQLPNPSTKIQIGTQVLSILQPRVVSYEEQDTALKQSLATAYESQNDPRNAAQTLQSITLDSSQRSLTPDDKAAIYLRIVDAHLAADDPGSASVYLNRVKTILHTITTPQSRLSFQLAQARILDSHRTFLEAASAYHSVSADPVLPEQQQLEMLGRAITCAVLAPAGPMRAKTLARLYKDERAPASEQFGILENIFLDRILAPTAVAAFASTLAPHQLSRASPDGATVLDKAVLEHNLLAASRLYANIGFDELGLLLGVEGERAEGYAAQMIEQGRLAGYIDQIDRFIFFEGEGSGEKKTKHVERAVGREVRKWDANVLGLAEEVERVGTLVRGLLPEFYEANMAH